MPYNNSHIEQLDFHYSERERRERESEHEYQKAIQESILLAERLEETQVKELVEKATHRTSATKNIVIILKRLSLLDDNVSTIHKIIEPVLNKYNDCSIDKHMFDKETHSKIFCLLNTIRFSEIEKKLLDTIFITHE
jgi:hypothetical protein